MSYGVFRMARAHRGYAAQLLRAHGLHTGQELIIIALAERGPQPQSALVEIERVDHSTVAKSLQRLQAAGIVTRTASPVDRRAMIVSLTRKGKAMYKKIQGSWAALEAATVRGLNKSERETLLALMKRVELAVAKADEGDAFDEHA